MKYKNVTTIATFISVALWLTTAWLFHISLASSMIVAILAAFAQQIAVTSAKREGALSERRTWLVDNILDQVGDGK